VLVVFAYGASALTGPAGSGLLHGLKLVAVAIVAQAVWGPDRERASIALVAALIILFSGSPLAQIGSIVLGGLAGLWLCRGKQTIASGLDRRTDVLQVGKNLACHAHATASPPGAKSSSDRSDRLDRSRVCPAIATGSAADLFLSDLSSIRGLRGKAVSQVRQHRRRHAATASRPLSAAARLRTRMFGDAVLGRADRRGCGGCGACGGCGGFYVWIAGFPVCG